jgi:hypothetical protein
MQIVRQFTENGLKLLLEHPHNTEDLVRLSGTPLFAWINFNELEIDRTTFVQPDYRHLESDLVLKAPLRARGELTWQGTLILYLLIEHQSEPDDFMLLRLIDYQNAIFRAQQRGWLRDHPTLAGMRLQPVLPIVLYTGNRSWPALKPLTALMDNGHLFKEITSRLKPLFVNLSTLSSRQLRTRGGYFGSLLRLVQQRRTKAPAFRRLLAAVVQHLEGLADQDRQRWLELLSYIHALVYHEREQDEHADLHERVVASVQTDPHRQEVRTMGQTIAEALKAEGRKEERRNNLLFLLRERFGELPRGLVATIEATTDMTQLEEWLKRFVKAKRLKDMNIPAAE